MNLGDRMAKKLKKHKVKSKKERLRPKGRGVYQDYDD